MAGQISKPIEIIYVSSDSEDDETERQDRNISPEVITLSSDSEPEPESAPPSPAISVCLDVSSRGGDPKTPSPTKDYPDWEVASEKKIPLSSECVTPRNRKTPRVRDLFGCEKKKQKPKPRRNLAKMLAKAQESGGYHDHESHGATTETLDVRQVSSHDIQSTSGVSARVRRRSRNVKDDREPVEAAVKPKKLRTIKLEVESPVPSKASKK